MTPDALKAWRESEGLTLQRCADLVEVHLRTWQRWEGGEVPPPKWLPAMLQIRYGSAPK